MVQIKCMSLCSDEIKAQFYTLLSQKNYEAENGFYHPNYNLKEFLLDTENQRCIQIVFVSRNSGYVIVGFWIESNDLKDKLGFYCASVVFIEIIDTFLNYNDNVNDYILACIRKFHSNSTVLPRIIFENYNYMKFWYEKLVGDDLKRTFTFNLEVEDFQKSCRKDIDNALKMIDYIENIKLVNSYTNQHVFAENVFWDTMVDYLKLKYVLDGYETSVNEDGESGLLFAKIYDDVTGLKTISLEEKLCLISLEELKTTDRIYIFECQPGKYHYFKKEELLKWFYNLKIKKEQLSSYKCVNCQRPVNWGSFEFLITNDR